LIGLLGRPKLISASISERCEWGGVEVMPYMGKIGDVLELQGVIETRPRGDMHILVFPWYEMWKRRNVGDQGKRDERGRIRGKRNPLCPP
jgi:hypothetical protein